MNVIQKELSGIDKIIIKQAKERKKMEKIWEPYRFSNNTAFIDEKGSSMTYGDLMDMCSDLSCCDTRSLVISLCTNTIGSAAGYAAFLEVGMVPMMLSAGMDRSLRQILIEDYRPKYLWLPEEMTAEFSGMEETYRNHGYVLLSTGYSMDYTMAPELALLLTTSGSTGSPKFVRQSYKNILANTRSIVEYLNIDHTERPITTLPMNYTYGLSIINTHLYSGATILLTDHSLMQKEFWDFFRKEKATSFGGVPYTYEILNKLRFFGMDLPSLRTMTQAGGKILPELHEKFARYADETGTNFVVMYGQCEATARMGYLPPERALEKKGSMGIAIPGGKFVLIDENGKEITTAHTTGELVYTGENVTLGYAECAEDLSKGDERNGRLETGDMAQFDEDGYYYIVGRKKRFLKIYGNRVNLDECERMLKGEFDLDLACGGTDDHMMIFVTKASIEKEILKYIVEKTKLNPAAFTVKIIDNIPKNDAGKTLYKELAKYY